MTHQPIGHRAIMRRLRTGVPPVSLFVGPPSVGKWTIAQWTLEHVCDIHPSSILEKRSLSIDTARELSWALRSTGIRGAIVFIDGASQNALNALLKTLEELPARARVILVATEKPMATIASRAELFSFSLLREAEVEEVLRRRNFNEVTAQRLAGISGGMVRIALRHAESHEIKVHVLAVAAAIQNRDAKTLDGFATRWSDEHSILLSTLCTEVITGRWRVFEEGEAGDLRRKLAFKILSAMEASIRPRLVVHSTLMDVLRGPQ